MARPKQAPKNLELLDIGALVLSLWFVNSVISNARDLIEQGIKNAPASYGLISALLLIGFCWYSRKKLNTWNIITLTILATSVAIWLLGLSTRAGY